VLLVVVVGVGVWCVGRRGPGEPDAKPERRISEVGSGGATDRVRELGSGIEYLIPYLRY